MGTTTRGQPAGPPAGAARPARRGIGRTGSLAAERVSDDLRRGTGSFLVQRRRIAGLSWLASFALGVVGLYQFGLLRHVPEPPLRIFGADAVDASGEAYQRLEAPDAALGLVSAATTLVLTGAGDSHRAQRAPWIPLALAAKTAGDATGALLLTTEQLTKHRRLCFWCTVAALAQVATLPLALPEARAALRRLRARG